MTISKKKAHKEVERIMGKIEKEFKERGYTQTQLMRESGLSLNVVHSLFSKTRHKAMKLDTLIIYLDILGMSYDEISKN